MHAKRYLVSAGLGFVAFLWMCLSASAAEIVGKVILSGGPVADVVISIEELKVENPADETVYVIDHRGLNFVPHVLVVRAGTVVRFENSDGMPCRIYSISPAGIFVLRRQDGKPMTITFDRPGVIEIRCAEHGRLYAYVVVKENPYFALSDPKGRYEISNVPPGRYTVQAWYEGTVVKRKTIKVGTDKLTIDFQAPRPQPKAREGQTLDSLSLAPLTDALPASLFLDSHTGEGVKK